MSMERGLGPREREGSTGKIVSCFYCSLNSATRVEDTCDVVGRHEKVLSLINIVIGLRWGCTKLGPGQYYTHVIDNEQKNINNEADLRHLE